MVKWQIRLKTKDYFQNSASLYLFDSQKNSLVTLARQKTGELGKHAA